MPSFQDQRLCGFRSGAKLRPTLPTSTTVSVIAHRGASAWLPEHTLAAYARAIEDGADFIEPDLVLTRDGVLVARHDVELSRSTTIAAVARFGARRTRKLVDGEIVEGWFCDDFTLAELRELRAREPMPDIRSIDHDGLHAIPTFDEIIELAASESGRRSRKIGIIPELKNSTWFHARGMDPERAILASLRGSAFLREAPFAIQSFEVSNLKALHESIGGQANILLVQLIGEADQLPFDRLMAGETDHNYTSMLTPGGLLEISRYADVVAANARSIIPWETMGEMGQAPSWIACAHAVGLRVHCWTLRPENSFLPPHLRCGDNPATRCETGSIEQMRALIRVGVDGLFTDDPALGRRAVDGAKASP